MVSAPLLCSKGVVTLVVKVGLLTVDKLPQAPPVPSVMLVPPPVRLPAPLGHVKVVLPCTAVLLVEP